MQMRRAGRTSWSEEDFNLAAETQERLIRSCYGRDGDNERNACFVRFQLAEKMERQGKFSSLSKLAEIRATIDELVFA